MNERWCPANEPHKGRLHVPVPQTVDEGVQHGAHTRNYIIKKLILKYDQCLSCFLHNPLLMLFGMFAVLFSRKKI